MRTAFSSQQIENCIVVVINPLVERAKEGASDAFVVVSQYICRVQVLNG